MTISRCFHIFRNINPQADLKSLIHALHFFLRHLPEIAYNPRLINGLDLLQQCNRIFRKSSDSWKQIMCRLILFLIDLRSQRRNNQCRAKQIACIILKHKHRMRASLLWTLKGIQIRHINIPSAVNPVFFHHLSSSLCVRDVMKSRWKWNLRRLFHKSYDLSHICPRHPWEYGG